VPPKYVELAQELERLIHAGKWKQGVPSVRELSFQHGVSLVTVSRAMQVLCDKRLLRSVHRSGHYLIENAQARQTWALMLRLTPGPSQSPLAQIITRAYDRLGRAENCQFLSDNLAVADETSPARIQRQVSEAKDAGLHGVFLLPSRNSDAALQQDQVLLRSCRKSDLPVVLLERNLRGLSDLDEWDLVCSTDVEGGRQCTRHLLELGRRRIAFIQGSPVSSHRRRLTGYLLELHHYNLEHPDRPLMPLVVQPGADIIVKEGFQALAEQLVREKADGVVCYQDYTALGLILELLLRKVSVPKHIAIVGFDDVPVGNAYPLGITTYAFDENELARQALCRMRDRILHPDRPPVRVEVPGKLIVRESSVA
jgi:LacI family transcriptional regulator